MQFVQPIKNKEQIDKIKEAMLEDGKQKECALFVLGINSGLRISDILKLRWKDVQGRAIVVKEQKTGKSKKFPINKNIKNALAFFTPDNPDAYIFASQSNRVGSSGQAWTRQYAYTCLNQYARDVGIDDKIGTHTMRKTFAYHVYKKTNDLALVMRLLNHSSPSETLRYIGVTQENMDAVYEGLNL